MRRDTRIVRAVLVTVPAAILAAATLCSWAIAQGASPQWRLLFRMMCHGRIERSLELFGVAMPICARCTAIYAAMFLGLIAFALLGKYREKVPASLLLLSIAPLAIDGLTQLTGLRESTNALRIATGFPAGLAFGFWVLSAVERRGQTLLSSS